jgi:glucosamine kinase
MVLLWFLSRMKELIIIADAGGTKTRAEALVDRLDRYEAITGPCVPYMDMNGALASILLARDIILTKAGIERNEAKIVLSLASAGLDTQSVTLQFRQALLAIVDEVTLISDGEAALEACFGTSPGAVIAIGTGVAIAGRDLEGQRFGLDGWGWPSGDRGGGAWTGRHVVEGFLSAHDRGDIHADPFHTHLASTMGLHRSEILAWLGDATRASYAALGQSALKWALKGSPAAGASLRLALEEIDAARNLLWARGIQSIHITGGFGIALKPFLDQGQFQFTNDAPFNGARLRAARWLTKPQDG